MGVKMLLRACVAVRGDHGEIERMLGMGVLTVGGLRFARLLHTDTGVCACVDLGCVLLFPHGGREVMHALARALVGAGCPAGNAAAAQYLEARGVVDALALAALARASSPAAVDLLLAQHELWARVGPLSVTDPARDLLLRRLLTPAAVAVVGPTNIGKSSLLNALAGRSVAAVADEPGTTRDHVGALIELDGVTVRWLDTPGLRTLDAGVDPSAEMEAAALALAMEQVRRADLVILCGDARSPPPDAAEILDDERADRAIMIVHLRADLGLALWPHDAAVSVLDAGSLSVLAARVRERLVPAEIVARKAPWKFWT